MDVNSNPPASTSSPGAAPKPLTIENNPYRANRPWPPDFSKLGPKHQFRLERKYKRRLRQATARPGWIRGVKLVQYGVCSGVAVYAVFFMDWGLKHEPFAELRGWARNLWTFGTRSPTRPNLGRVQAEPEPDGKGSS